MHSGLLSALVRYWGRHRRCPATLLPMSLAAKADYLTALLGQNASRLAGYQRQLAVADTPAGAWAARCRVREAEERAAELHAELARLCVLA